MKRTKQKSITGQTHREGPVPQSKESGRHPPPHADASALRPTPRSSSVLGKVLLGDHPWLGSGMLALIAGVVAISGSLTHPVIVGVICAGFPTPAVMNLLDPSFRWATLVWSKGLARRLTKILGCVAYFKGRSGLV